MSLSKPPVLLEILDRVMDVAGSRTDTATATALGVSSQTLYNWKSRETIPYEALCQFADNQGLALDYLLFGVEPKFRRRTEIDAHLLGGIGAAVEVLSKSGFRTLTFGERYFYIGLVYNRLLRLPENVRSRAVSDEVNFLFSVLRQHTAADKNIERLMEKTPVAPPKKRSNKS